MNATAKQISDGKRYELKRTYRLLAEWYELTRSERSALIHRANMNKSRGHWPQFFNAIRVQLYGMNCGVFRKPPNTSPAAGYWRAGLHVARTDADAREVINPAMNPNEIPEYSSDYPSYRTALYTFCG